MFETQYLPWMKTELDISVDWRRCWLHHNLILQGPPMTQMRKASWRMLSVGTSLPGGSVYQGWSPGTIPSLARLALSSSYRWDPSLFYFPNFTICWTGSENWRDVREGWGGSGVDCREAVSRVLQSSDCPSSVPWSIRGRQAPSEVWDVWRERSRCSSVKDRTIPRFSSKIVIEAKS